MHENKYANTPLKRCDEEMPFPCKNGIFKNPDVFDVDESEVDEFDMTFEYKEKIIQEGQLGV